MNEQPELNIDWPEALGEHASNPPPSPTPCGDSVISLDQEWVVSGLENRIKAQFVMWVRRNAKQSFSDESGEEGEASRSSYVGDFGAGHYNWNGRYIRKALGDWPGIQYLFYLLLRRNHPEVTESKAEAIFKGNPRGCSLTIAWAQGNSESPSTKEVTGTKRQGANGHPTTETDEPTMTARQWREMSNRKEKERGPVTTDADTD